MDKKILLFMIVFISSFIIIPNTNALETYVGVKILNLTDQEGTYSSCAWDSEIYGFQGRIRALSSVLPNYPIFFNLTYTINASAIGTWNSTQDTDYTIGDVIYIPEMVNLNIGEYYNLMFDIDAIRIYLDITSNPGSFTKTYDNEYWTSGYVGTSSTLEYYVKSASTSCLGNSTLGAVQQASLVFISNNRTNLMHTCMTDATTLNCDENGFTGLSNSSVDAYLYYNKAGYLYQNLYENSIGNFYLTFQLS